MGRRTINICLFILVFMPSLLGAHDFSPLGNIRGPESQCPRDTNQRETRTPECPSCVFLEEDSIDPFLHEDTESCQLKSVSPLIPTAAGALLNQGFVRSIFRPPAPIF